MDILTLMFNQRSVVRLFKLGRMETENCKC